MVSSFAGRLYGLLDLHKGRANAYQIELGSLRKVAQFYTLHPSSQNISSLLFVMTCLASHPDGLFHKEANKKE